MYGFHEVDAATLKQWFDTGVKFRLVDVRTPAEMSRGVIDGAELMPLHLVPLRAAELTSGGRVVFYCQSGARSAQACAFMAQQGMEDVYNLRGGVMGWVASGSRLATPSRESLIG
ncbi:rhodanese-like domain-containing protein [Acidihalobacter ferrooxydans]|uniref:Sulfurtransferase n=1 Tax=Acidihalobacter ferrooxydans TaxID=1765967 RepID=A0A1P8UHS2_9GAMM|nr:rhodanese-like domain-containing protein [Acidihalobacter ferrooxydans]APZ43372.1 sulfurtransferase [Acidihalobacter ferrooxydans]